VSEPCSPVRADAAGSSRRRPADNPFRAERIESPRFRPLRGTWPELRRQLEDAGWRAAIVGPEGSGKTTLLETLDRELQGEGRPTAWLRFTLERPRPGPAEWATVGRATASRAILLVDGADLLPTLSWRWLRWRARRVGGLLVTSHGRRLMPACVHTSTTPALLAHLVREIAGEPIERFGVDAETIWRAHDGNVREALRELYDRCAGGGAAATPAASTASAR